MQELVSLLAQRLKVDSVQAQGGAGILFRAARDKLGSGEFTRLLGSLPGLDALMARAPDSRPSGLLGGFASLAGGNTAIIAGVVSGFSKLGLTTEHAQKFVPVILDYLRTQVDPDVVSRLEKTLRA
jgi:Protein of unknown function VcgC/VcgE (DUF2780)